MKYLDSAPFRSPPNSDAYREGHERIFGKKDKKAKKRKPKGKEPDQDIVADKQED